MATPINAPLTAESCDPSIEELFATLPATPCLGGSGPFVINLSASSAPISLPPHSLVGGHQARAYQIRRLEDRRLRYRLRLGPFVTENDADSALAKVRDVYPGALTATADADDLRALASLDAKLESRKPAAEKQSDKVMTPPPAPSPPILLELAAFVAPPTLPAWTQVVLHSEKIPTLEFTHTVRALTSLELNHSGALRWYVIQLSISEAAFDPDTVPDLDIFSVYRLYSVASIEQGKIMHALRVGFFGEEGAAAAVANYLKSFYDKPTIRRVSAAERERFANQPLEPRKDVGAVGKHAVIEITDERYVRERSCIGPAVMAVKK